ncbi:MAG TPA: (d)CMP kinase [Solirubrobacteraceae bacterium]|nr:(d)CMP kinase [Solirubrobacteraceae bacterium]
MLIAIDGPAGAGKSTVARALASALGFAYLDSGAMYRCVGLLSLDWPETPAGRLAREARIELGERIVLNGRDVSDDIRTQQVAQAASRVAADPEVRRAVVSKQRELIASGDWVAEGRDIGTVVAPGAELKVFLTASAQERARRRALESDEDVATVLAEQAQRDARDLGREHSPLTAASDAIELDTTGLTAQEVVGRIALLAGAAGHTGLRAT